MTEINHFALAKKFGARVSRVAVPSFGFFSALKTIEIARVMGPDEATKFDTAEDILIAQAFEETRDGLSADVVLSDPEMKDRFYQRCQAKGVKSSRQLVFKRLMRFRKDKSIGIRLLDATRDSGANPGSYLVAAEIAYTEQSYEHGSSVDDLLVNDSLATEFVEKCALVTPGGSHLDYVTAALYLRKTRNFNKVQAKKLEEIELSKLEPRFRLVGTFDQLSLTDVPQNEGIFLIGEKVDAKADRSLYVGGGENLQAAFSPFEQLRPFRVIPSHYWEPDPARVFLRVASLSKKFEGTSSTWWQKKLIYDRKPLFNIPVHVTKKTAA